MLSTPSSAPAESRRVALVTGASGGIGRAIAYALAADAIVWVGYHHNADGAAATVQHIDDTGGLARAVQGNVADPDDITAMLEAAHQTTGQIDILVNNAGGGGSATGDGSLLDLQRQGLEDTFALNLFGSVDLTRLVATRLIERGATGSIVNIGSILGHVVSTDYLAYNAAKAAVSNFTQTAALALAPNRITVNCVAPGFIGGTKNEPGWTAAAQRDIPFRIPLHVGRPDDIAAAVRFLTSPDARYITGQTLLVDGGFSIDGVYPGSRQNQATPQTSNESAPR